MIIDLQKIPIVWMTTTVRSSIKKQDRIESMFKRLELTNTTKHCSDRMKHRSVGCATAHRRANESVEDILPALILEDDAIETEHFKSIIEVPDDADALYLGHSTYIGKKSRIAQARWEPVNDDIIRVKYMHCCHAIVTISNDYLLSCRDCQTERINHPKRRKFQDQYRAADMKNWNVYATLNPFFKQAGRKTTHASITLYQPNGEMWPQPEGILHNES